MPASARRTLAALAAAALSACGHSGDGRCDLAGTDWVAWQVASGTRYALGVSRPDGSCARDLVPHTATETQPVLSVSHGVVVYVAAGADGQHLAVHRLADGTDRTLSTGPLTPSRPTLSPDGTTVAFQGWVGVGGQSDVWKVPLAGGDPVLVASSARAGGAPAYDGGPSWGPDGWIYFLSDRTGRYQVFRTHADGVDPELVTTTPSPTLGGIVGAPSISPDGRTLAFARVAADSTARVVLRDVVTGEERLLADVNASEPAFDADGRRVATSQWGAGFWTDVVVRDVATGAVLGTAAGGGVIHASPAFAR